MHLSWLHRWNDLVCLWRLARTFVLVCTWPWCCCSRLVQFKVIIAPHSLSKYMPQWRSSVCVYVGPIMERSRWPWTNRPYVCIPTFRLQTVIGIKSRVMPWRHPHSFLQYITMAIAGVNYVAWIDGMIALALTTRWYVNIPVCLALKVSCWFNAAWGHNLTGILCQNILHCRWSVCILYWLHRWNDLGDSGRTAGTFVFLRA